MPAASVKRSSGSDSANGPGGIACVACRHRIGVGFEAPSPAETEFMHGFKLGHDFAPAGSWIPAAPGDAPFLFTLYSGWVLRCRAEAGGRRRAAGIALPGELIGLETVTGIATDLRVRALTDVTFCRFDPTRWRELLAVPSLSERIARLETIARIDTEERLLAAGRSATANVAHFFATLHDGLARRKLVRDDGFGLPLTLATVAECLNLTPVHLRRVLQKLAAQDLLLIRDHRVVLRDPARLRALGGGGSNVARAKPLI